MKSVNPKSQESAVNKQKYHLQLESAAKYRAIFESTGTATLIVNEDTTIALANQEFEHVVGFKPEELVGRKWTDFIMPEDLEQMLKYHKLGRQHPDLAPRKYEARILNKNGEIRNALLYIRLIIGTTQSVVSILDITDRIRSEERYSSLVANLPVGIFRSTPEGKVIFANPAMARIYGYLSVEELLKVPATDYYTNHSSRAKMLEALGEKNTLLGYITKEHKKDGSIIWVSTNYTAIRDQKGKIIYIDGVVIDVTERITAEKALRESELKFRTLAENVPGVIYLCNNDPRYTMLYISENVITLTGYPADDFLMDKISFTDLYHPDDKANIYKQVDAALAARQPFHLIYRIKHKNGEWRWIEETGAGVFERDKLLHLEGYLQDITARKHAEDALRLSEARLSTATKIAKLGYWEINYPDNAFVFDDNFYAIFHTTAAKEGGYKMTPEQYAKRFLHPDDQQMVAIEIQKSLQVADPNYHRQMEHRIIYADGGVGWISVNFFIKKDTRGRTIGASGVNQDITERKLAEEEYKQLINSMSETVWVINFEGKFVEVNAAAVKQLGYSREELLTMGPKDIDPNLSTVEIDQLIEGMKSDELQHFETEHRTKSGRIIPVEISSTLVSYHGQSAILSIARDITERKLAEENIRRITEGTRAILWHAEVTKMKNEANGCLGYSWDTHYLNLENISNLLPLKGEPDTDLGQRFHNSILEEDRLRMAEVSAKAFKDNAESYEQEYRLEDANGTLHWMREHVDIDKIDASHYKVTGIIMDICELKRVEEELDLAVQSAKVGLWNQDFRTGKITRNAEWANMLGYELSEVESNVNFFFNLIHPDDLPIVKKVLKDHENGKSRFLEVEHRMRTKDGNWKWILNLGQVVEWDAQGKPLRAAGVHLDITERKQAEETLQESEERYRAVVENSYEGILIVGEDYKFNYVNETLCTMLERKRKDLIGHDFREFLDEESKSLVADHYRKRQRGEKVPSRYEFNVVRKNGDKRRVEISSTVVRDAEGKTRTIAQLLDITERKQAEAEKQALEAQLFQSQKMEAVGNLAGGIAHDFNNLLTIIQGHAQLLMAAKNESDREYYELKQIVNASFRAAQLTRQLLLFSRKQEMTFEILNPNQTIDNLSKMLERLIGEDIVINLQLDDNLWNIEADEGNLEQVIMNLVVNARDAMPHGGTLTIKTENLELSEPDCVLIPNSIPGNFTRLTIQDTGCGIPTEVIDKIFDPFFTTKEAGKGTGLGLSVAYGIIKKHNGWINIESEPGKGTIFTIYLPASQKSVLDTYTPKDQPVEKLGKGEPILVIEDDDDVRKFMATILRHYNYVPLEAADAAAAATIFQKEKEKIKLIVADVILPDKNGILLVEELLATQANIPVIMCSGYADEKVRQDIIQKKKFHFLQKPIKAPIFLDLVQETLTSAKK